MSGEAAATDGLLTDPRAVGRQALAASAHFFPRAVDLTKITPAEIALAGLGRCRRLLEGMLRLHDDFADLAGALARPHLEVWTWSLFLLLDGDAALPRLQANELSERRKHAQAILRIYEGQASLTLLEERFVSDARRVLADSDAEAAKLGLSTFSATEALSDLLAEANDENFAFPRKVYALLYRRESQQSVHGQLPAMRRHIPETTDGLTEIVATPDVQVDHGRRLELTVAANLALAKKVGEELALDVSAVDALVSEWF